jgi:hypothetical protein
LWTGSSWQSTTSNAAKPQTLGARLGRLARALGASGFYCGATWSLHFGVWIHQRNDVAQGFLNTLDSITPLLSVIHYNTNKIKHFTLHPSHTAKHHPHPSMLADDREMVFLSFFSYLLVGIIQN